VDCNLARRLLPFSRTGGADLDAADRASLAHHLEACPGCAAADRAFDANVGRAMRAVPVPNGFSARLHTRLLAARMAFYRGLALRGLVIACIAVAVWGGWSMWRWPSLDAGLVAHQTYQMSGLSRSDAEARASATEWLRTAGAGLQAPEEFDYRLLSFVCRSDFQGVNAVPTLVFARGGATLRLHVVRENAFKNLGDLRDAVEDGGCTVEPRRYDSMPGWVFIAVTSGAPLDAFRLPPRLLDPA
jgi:hypothetical protein